mmetsp:Transcript_9224/g.23076  ORF Transcript_9224/g.23076 Transcript_9224/m.23076 type:complete len:251 (+) Transcript_9224:255-1007(+)
MVFFGGSMVPPGFGKKAVARPTEGEVDAEGGEVGKDRSTEWQPDSCDERCCPGFWSDTGVPGIPPFSWVFDPGNKLLNDNKYMNMFGSMGFQCADYYRKRFMGVALFVTVLAMGITSFGCFALSDDPEIIRWTAWSTAWYKNETSMQAGKLYFGLHSLVITTCNDIPDFNGGLLHRDSTNCKVYNTIEWSNVDQDHVVPYGWDWDSVSQCKEQSVTNQMGAFTTAATLLFAMNGCLTRIRTSYSGASRIL